jgi:dihydrofolate reductase
MTPTPAIVTCRTSISLDGFTAGPNQSPDEPFGAGGMRLNEWQFETDRPGRSGDAEVLAEASAGIGAYVMGRHMFGPGRGPWDLAWRGWWGEDPPYHAPVFVLTHHARAPLPMQGGTTFTFVTEGIEAALALARAAAGGQKVSIAGGAHTIRQYLRAGLVDELYLHLVPFTLGAGERLFEDVGSLTLSPIKVVGSAAVTHLKYAVVR